MCGIAGVMNLTSTTAPTRELLERMIRQVHHRGPDGYGFHIDERVGLAHARLSIIDLEGGWQPIHNEDKSVWVVFNGEIFNYVELREDLIKLGHQFYTHSDTEVIVHLYEQYGESFVNHLNGQYAIALWDTRRSCLYLIRDRVGINPLFYSNDRGRLVFGSEVKTLLPAFDAAPRLDAAGLDQIMTFWTTAGSATIFENVQQVRPGQMLRCDATGIATIPYWDFVFPTDENFARDENQLAEQLYSHLEDAVRIRLRSDVPVGAYLSGGLDSSVITALMHKLGANLRTFSIGFSSSEHDESEYQRLMIDHLNADHSKVVCHDHEIAENFPKAIWLGESPILRTAPVPMMLLSRLVREQNYRVVLTGEGSDEILGGYDIFKETKIRSFWAKNPQSRFRPALLKRLYPYLDISSNNAQEYLQAFFGVGLNEPQATEFSHLTRWTNTANCKNFFSGDLKSRLRADAFKTLEQILPPRIKQWHSFNKAQYLEARTLMAGYLLSSQGDRMLLGNSVEGRFPYLDHRVIEFANSLHPNLKMKVLNEKYLLKRAMQTLVPAKIRNRYKQPYRAPDIAAFNGSNPPDYISYLLSSDTIKNFGYFDVKKVELLLKKVARGTATSNKDNMAYVGILSTQMWHQHFIAEFQKNFAN